MTWKECLIDAERVIHPDPGCQLQFTNFWKYGEKKSCLVILLKVKIDWYQWFYVEILGATLTRWTWRVETVTRTCHTLVSSRIWQWPRSTLPKSLDTQYKYMVISSCVHYLCTVNNHSNCRLLPNFRKMHSHKLLWLCAGLASSAHGQTIKAWLSPQSVLMSITIKLPFLWGVSIWASSNFESYCFWYQACLLLSYFRLGTHGFLNTHFPSQADWLHWHLTQIPQPGNP
jgi:hypothetical protein